MMNYHNFDSLYIFFMENRLEKNVNKLIERYKKTSQ